jgi:hypothetical protein
MQLWYVFGGGDCPEIHLSISICQLHSGQVFENKYIF